MQHVQIGLVGSGRIADRLGAALLVAEAVSLKPVLNAHQDSPQTIVETGLNGLIVAENNADTLALARSALEAGLAVFMGTLSGLTLEDVIELRRAEFSAPRPGLKFGFPLRHHESLRYALSFVEDANLGTLISGRAVYGTAKPLRDRRGAMVQHGYELLDLLHAFTGPFEEVMSMVGERVWARETGPDNIMALMRTGGGVMVMMHGSTTQWRHTFRLELTYQNGYIWLDGLNKLGGDLGPEMLITATTQTDDAGEIQPNPREQIDEFKARDISVAQVGEFLDFVRGDAPIQHGSSQQAFDVINTAERIMAADPSWFPLQGD